MNINLTNNYTVNMALGACADAALTVVKASGIVLVIFGLFLGAETVTGFLWRLAGLSVAAAVIAAAIL